MNTVETINTRVSHLPLQAQEEVLQAIDRIALRYPETGSHSTLEDGNGEYIHPLTAIANLAMDVGVTDLADRHDFYAHGKLED